MLQSPFIPNQFSSDTSSHLHLSLSCSYKLHFCAYLVCQHLTTSLIFHQENDSIWEHATMEPYPMHARKSRTGKKRFGYTIFTKVNAYIFLCAFLAAMEETWAISVWLHGILHRILHFITHREADSHFDFTPTCYKIRTESIQTITKKEFMYLASVGGNALNEGGGSFLKKSFFSFLSLSLLNTSSSLLLLLLLYEHVSCIVWAKY